MGLVCEKGVLTAPAATGTQTYNLGSAFDGITPKAIILWATYETAAGSTNGDAIFTIGFGTRSGGATQQCGITYFSDDTPTSSAVVQGNWTDAAIKAVTADGTAVDYAANLNAFTSGTPSDFRLNWTDVPASQILVHYLVLGGTDITDAWAGQFTGTTAVATQDVTVNAGFGKPDALLFATSSWNALGITQTDAALGFGAGTSSADGRSSLLKEDDAAANMALGSLQGAFAMQFTTGAVAKDADMNLTGTDKSAWPTDGFEVTYADQLGFAFRINYLALKGTLAMKTGVGTAPTTGTPTQTLTGTADTTARGALLFSTGQTNSAAIVSSGTRLGQFTLGGWDGTNDGCASITQEDGAATSFTGRDFSSTKAIRLLDAVDAAAPSLQGEADGGLSGADATLAWTDADTQASEYGFVIFGEVPPPIPFPVTLLAPPPVYEGPRQ